MVQKKLIDFTLEEAVKRAVGAFGEQDTEGRAMHNDEREALKTVVHFKISQQQSEINRKLNKLTAWLVWLTITLVVLTILQVFKVFIS